MSNPHRHHHVPRFLLRQWADTNGKIPSFLRKAEDEELLRKDISTKDASVIKGLYSLRRVETSLRNHPERTFFQQIDHKAAQIHAALLSGRKITSIDKKTWSQFIFVMRFRTPDFVANIRSFGEAIVNRKVSEFPGDEADQFSKYADLTVGDVLEVVYPGAADNYGFQMLLRWMSTPEFIDPIANMHMWVVDASSANREFLITDHPVLFTSGLGQSSCVVALPISPHKAFFASNTPRTQEKHNKVGANRIARALNQSIVQQANRFVYGRAQKDFVERWMSTASPDPLSNFDKYLDEGLFDKP